MANASNAFTVAKDIALVLVGPLGAIPMPRITGFDSKAVYETVKSKVLDGPTRQVSLPDGHNLDIKFDREDGMLDTTFTLIEAAYFAIGGFVPQFTLYEYITERDGSTSRFEYTEVDFQYEPGSWKSGSAVSGNLKGFARFKRAV